MIITEQPMIDAGRPAVMVTTKPLWTASLTAMNAMKIVSPVNQPQKRVHHVMMGTTSSLGHFALIRAQMACSFFHLIPSKFVMTAVLHA